MPLDFLFGSSAKTAGAAVSSPNLSVPQGADLRADLIVTASSAPTTLDVKIEHSEDGGTTWQTLASFTQVGAVGTAKQSLQIPGPTSGLIRGTYTSVGTSYTWSLTLRSQPQGQ